MDLIIIEIKFEIAIKLNGEYMDNTKTDYSSKIKEISKREFCRILFLTFM